ncbi:zinc finger, CCHC-type containing protein [Tanacetum coccineum]
MTRAKFDIEKFNGTGDFGLWRINMRALSIQYECEAALEGLPADMEAQAKAELNKKAHSAVILCLGNKVLREVTRETTAAGVWSKLKTLYMTKSLANKLYLKKKLYTFYMPAGQKFFEHIDEFNKIVLDLANTEDEDLALLLHFFRWDSSQSRGKSRSKSRGGRLKCYICQFEDHLKRNCPKNNHKKSTGYFKKDEQPSSSGSTYDDFELGDNKEFKIRGIGKVRIQLRDGSTFVLHNVRIRRDNCIYSLDGHEVVGGYVFISSSSNIKHLEIQRVEAKVENQTGRKVKKLRTDNGLEFCNRESPSTAIETKTPMDMWSGHPSDHGMLSIFGYVVYPHDKQEVKNHTLEKDQIDQKDGDDEDAGDQETDQTSDLTYYQLAQDRELRTRTKPLRFQDESNMAAYAFVVPEEEDTHEPLTYQEAVACEDSSKWKDAMKEEMDSLRKNKTWELVDHPAGKKLMNYELERLDVKTTFLHGNLEEVIYMRQAPGYDKLTRSYAPGEYIYLLLYVDDMLIACKSKAEHNVVDALTKVVHRRKLQHCLELLKVGVG